MSKALDVLDAQNAYYQIKFSGHRSLHLMIPAEAFPRDFRGSSINEQFRPIEKKIKAYLPDTGHATAGFRVVYSTHPIGAMVSIPLTRREVPTFRPWMANIHTVAVDFDWFQIPEGAVERTENFLNAVFDSRDGAPTTLSAPIIKPIPVKAYTGDNPMEKAEVLQAIDSEHPQERVAAARAALIQDMQLPQEKLARLLSDVEKDSLWFGTEIALRDASQVTVKDFVQLLAQEDDYLNALAHQLLGKSTVQADSVFEYLVSQEGITKDTVTAVVLMADMDWQMFVECPARISASSLQEWFEKIWIICGAALCLSWQHKIEDVFENAYRQARAYEASDDECNDKIHQLELLLKLRNKVPRKYIKDDLLFQPADELIQYGHDLRTIIMSMLNAQHPFTSAGAARFLTNLWWDDCIDILIQRLDSGSSSRKSALRALLDIGEPAAKPLLHALQTSRNQRIIIMTMETLGQLGDTRAIPAIRERANHRNERIYFNSRRVLKQYFGIEVEQSRQEDAAPDASETEER